MNPHDEAYEAVYAPGWCSFGLAFTVLLFVEIMHLVITQIQQKLRRERTAQR